MPPTDGFEPLPDTSRLLAGTEVRALAHGRVVTAHARARTLTQEHFYYERHELLRVRSESSGLEELKPRPGDAVTRGQRLGRAEEHQCLHAPGQRHRLSRLGRLSWGCIVLHTPDITTLYERIPEGAMGVLF